MSDLFNADHGAGKGDTSRTRFDSNWAKRFEEINWGNAPEGFSRKGNKQVKRYGPDLTGLDIHVILLA